MALVGRTIICLTLLNFVIRASAMPISRDASWLSADRGLNGSTASDLISDGPEPLVLRKRSAKTSAVANRMAMAPTTRPSGDVIAAFHLVLQLALAVSGSAPAPRWRFLRSITRSRAD